MIADQQGNLADKSLGELICEIQQSSASGALRLSRERAKTVIYFEDGVTVFAVSNIRAHRLIEFLRRSGLAAEEVLAKVPPTATDDDALALITTQGNLNPEQIGTIRANQVSDMLRATFLWTQGHWQFDTRVRVAKENRVAVDTQRLLLESSRHLPGTYIKSRFANRDEHLETPQQNGQSLNLSPSEAFVLSRVSAAMSIKDLLALGGMPEEETLRSIYALTTAGVLRRAGTTTASVREPRQRVRATSVDETLEDFLARIDKAADHYEMLNIDRTASADEVKNSYHALARNYHPDRFHQASASVRTRIDSAFARIAHAYEVLHDASTRATYDERLKIPGAVKPLERTPSQPAENPTKKQPGAARISDKQTGNEDRAEASFQKGLAALKENQSQHALRLFAEAASLEPRRARYRAEYGRVLINDPQTRRIAEFELKAAIALEPNNISYRVALAELYKALGLRRRAEGELQRALMSDPNNDVARQLLASLKN
jgi:curved DNA-binding protein CbpA